MTSWRTSPSGAGDLRERFEFEARPEGNDGRGNAVVGDFSAVFEMRAQVFSETGRGEAVMAARLSGRSLITVRVRQCRATRAVTTDWRLRDVRTKVIYNVRDIADPLRHSADRGKWLDLLCESGVAT